jgi:hypothetical protein
MENDSGLGHVRCRLSVPQFGGIEVVADDAVLTIRERHAMELPLIRFKDFLVVAVSIRDAPLPRRIKLKWDICELIPRISGNLASPAIISSILDLELPDSRRPALSNIAFIARGVLAGQES